MKTFLIIFVCLVVVFAADQVKKYVTPKVDNIGVYQNEVRGLYETPIFTVNTSDRLIVLTDKGKDYKIQNSTGQVGWVEKRYVVATGRNKTFVFDNADVVGYLYNPTPIYIIDADDQNTDPINLNRSFKEEMKENVDKETTERRTSK